MTQSLEPFLTPPASSTTPSSNARRAKWLWTNSALPVPLELTLTNPKLRKCAQSATLASTIQIFPSEPAPNVRPSRMLRVSRNLSEPHLQMTARGNVQLVNTTMSPRVFAEIVDTESTSQKKANFLARFVELV